MPLRKRSPTAVSSRLAKHPVLARHDVEIPSLSPNHEGLRIAHLTDIHVGRMTPVSHVRAAIDLANACSPDVIALTGDYVCWHRREIDMLRNQIAGLRAPLVVAALGNHDYFADGDGVADALTGAGYTVLRNRHHSATVRGALLHVIGLDDPVTRRHDIARSHEDVPDGGTRLVLSHCPEQADELAARGADLILSGHTHGGQIFLKGVTDRLFEKAGKRYYRRGLYKIGGSHLYVSSGVGYSGVRVRAGHGTQSEVALFTLRRAASC